MHQTHSNRVIVLNKNNKNFKNFYSDAIITTIKGYALGVVTADCVPILLYDNKRNMIAAIHAGWKGLIAGVIQSCISSFIKDEVDLSAWIGPSISSKHYEVDKEFYDAFLSSDEASLSNFNKIRSDKWLFSLQGEAHRILKKYDVEVQDSNQCTFENQDLFYSYRRNQTNNRLLTIIWRNE